MSVFDKWNKNIDKDFMENLRTQESGEGGGFESVPNGTYEVCINKLELKSSKKGDPMFCGEFKIIGEKDKLKGQRIWMNQVILQPFQIHIVNEFLRSLDSGIDVEFVDYAQYNDVILDIAEAVANQKLEYALKVGETEKGFKTFTIIEVFESEE